MIEAERPQKKIKYNKMHALSMLDNQCKRQKFIPLMLIAS
jgi:hypothetical protein